MTRVISTGSRAAAACQEHAHCSGTNYRNAIAAYVNFRHQAGMYAIVDMHWSAQGTLP